MLVYGIVSTNTHPWGSARTLSVLAIGLSLLGVFVLIEARLAENPLVPLGVFRRRSINAANAVALTVGASIFSSFFFLSLYLQQINGYTRFGPGWPSCRWRWLHSAPRCWRPALWPASESAANCL